MTTFTLYWRTGKREVVNGDTISEACTLAGYGGGAVQALDFYQHGDVDTHMWDSVIGRWYSKKSFEESREDTP